MIMSGLIQSNMVAKKTKRRRLKNKFIYLRVSKYISKVEVQVGQHTIMRI